MKIFLLISIVCGCVVVLEAARNNSRRLKKGREITFLTTKIVCRRMKSRLGAPFTRKVLLVAVKILGTTI